MKARSAARTLLVSAAFWTSIGSAAQSSLNTSLENVLAEEGLTGMAWTLVLSPDQVSTGAVGVRDKPGGLPFTKETRFHVGSLTKTVLATGVLRLATEGRLQLDDPALNFLNGLFKAAPPPGFEDITVRHLLDHTSSLDDAQLWQMFSERAAPNAPLRAAFPAAGQQLQLRAVPGTRFSYSNVGYTLLGMIIESITGDRYEHYLDRQLLGPLAMTDSTFRFTTQAGEDADDRLAWGHVDDGSRYKAAPSFLRPAGQFTSTAADLGRFLQFLMGDGVIDRSVFIQQDMMRARGQPVGTEAADAGLIAGYALGLGRRDRHGVVAFCHGGNIVGFVAMACIFPERQKAFAYSVNTDSETANYGRLDALLIDALGVAPTPVPPTVSAPADAADWQGRYVLSPNRFQSFAYLDRMFGGIKVSVEDDQLLLTYLQRGPRALRPTGEGLYSADDRTTTSHVLTRGADGSYLLSDGFQTYERAPATHLALHWASLLLGMSGLIWIAGAGTVELARDRARFWRKPLAPAYLGLLTLLVPVPLFFTQSFMALGDMTTASLALAASTLLLPLGTLLTLVRALRVTSRIQLSALHAIAAALVLQWCAVLSVNGLLPFRLWA